MNVTIYIIIYNKINYANIAYTRFLIIENNYKGLINIPVE